MADAAILDADQGTPKLRMKNAHLEATGLSEQVGFSLRFAHAAVWADLNVTLEPFNLRPQHYAALLIIAESAGCKQQEIGEALGIFRSNLVALIEDLSSRGLVSRTVKPDDRRSYALSLTEKGAAVMVEANNAHAAHRSRVMNALAPYDANALIEMLDRLATLDGAVP